MSLGLSAFQTSLYYPCSSYDHPNLAVDRLGEKNQPDSIPLNRSYDWGKAPWSGLGNNASRGLAKNSRSALSPL